MRFMGKSNRNMIAKWFRDRVLLGGVNRLNRLRLKNKEFSLISSNCNGGMILHDLGLRFNSPFVNLWISPSDFIKMLGRLNYYMSCELVLKKEADCLIRLD